LVTVGFAVAVLFLGLARTQGQGNSADSASLRQIVTDLQRQVADLNATVHQQAATIHTLQSRIDAQGNTISGLSNTVTSQAQKLQFVTVEGTEMYITGANVNIRDGTGNTLDVAQPSGLGNLIIGYNENGDFPCAGCPSQPTRPRTGSHNLVLGEFNGYTSFGGIVAGFGNSISGPFATVTGGAYSSASGMFSSVSGGEINLASVEGAAVSGGFGGIASGRWSSVSGGQSNTAESEVSSVSGGGKNTASGLQSSITGGVGNKITSNGQDSSISGGAYRTMDTAFTWAAGSLVSP
jgi:hypothetical protein